MCHNEFHLGERTFAASTVNRICSPTLKLGNASFPPNDTMNLRIPRGVTSTPTRLLTRIRQSCISSTRRAPSTSSGNAVAKSVHFLCKSSRSIASACSHERFSVQQEAKSFVQIFELLKPSIQTSHDCVKSRLHHSPCCFLCCIRAASASNSPGIFLFED